MPIYEYECEICGNQLTLMQSFGEAAPMCTHGEKDENSTSGYTGVISSISMKKKISKTSFTLKGSGWAKDNYGGNKK